MHEGRQAKANKYETERRKNITEMRKRKGRCNWEESETKDRGMKERKLKIIKLEGELYRKGRKERETK